MRWLSRRNPSLPPSAAAIDRFWRWWGQVGRAAVESALAANEPHRVTGDLTSRVAAIHESLAWQLSPSDESDHLLIVSADGDPELRATARRWLKAAPSPDRSWSFADLKQPADDVDSIELRVHDTVIPLAEVRVGARPNGARFDVLVHHPQISHLSDDARIQATFLALDYAIGERAVELWLGTVGASLTPPLDAFPLSQLRTQVAAHELRLIDAEGNPSWVVLNGTGPRGTVVAAAQSPLASITAPELDTHVGLVVPYRDSTDNGLPTVQALRELTALEDHLCDRLGTDGRLVAHESSAGHRILHFYVAGESPGPDALEAAASGWVHGEVDVSASADPAWSAVGHLRT